jgi:hypothetical protein
MRNGFGLWREYPHGRPSYDPDTIATTDDLSDRPAPPELDIPEPELEEVDPTTNHSLDLLMGWQNNNNKSKSEGELDKLVHEVLHHPQFDPKEIPEDFNAQRESKRMDEAAASVEASPFQDGFTEASVEIEIPSGVARSPPVKFQVPGLHYRPLLSVIKAAFSAPLATRFHLFPFELYHKIADKTTRVFEDIYNSDVFLQEHKKIQDLPLPPGEEDGGLERVIAALMFWSDSTHLANFGNAKLWPIYLLFGNLSKYIRAQPTSGACNHIAYIPSVCSLTTIYSLDSILTPLQL